MSLAPLSWAFGTSAERARQIRSASRFAAGEIWYSRSDDLGRRYEATDSESAFSAASTNKAFHDLESPLKRLALLAALCVLLLSLREAHAQEFDAAFGFGSLISPGANNTTGVPSLGGGLYPSVSADYLIHHRLGVQAEVSWRGSQGLYENYQPYRPVLYDINALWAPRLGKKASAELMAGIGGEDLRFYQGYFSCTYISCANYVSSQHFLGHVGAGIRYYVRGHLFVRPEASLYLVHNNQEFSSGQSARFGVSIGYSFTRGF